LSKATVLSDCIVIGAGAIGLLSALALTERGLSVTILERQQAGREASWAGGGILCPLYPWRYSDPINRLAFWSTSRYATLCTQLWERTGIDPQWTDSGLLILDPPKKSEVDNWATRFGQTVSWQSAAELFHPLPDRDAAWLPEIGQVRNPRLLQALIAAVRKKGIKIREHCPVLELQTRGGRVTGVKTPNGQVAAEQVVIAAGAWSQTLIPGMLPPRIYPVRGQMLRLQTTPGTVPAILMDEGIYLIPRRDGGVIVGSTVEHVGYDKSTTEAARHQLHRHALKIWPQLDRAPITHHWAGLRPGSDDGIPTIGEHPDIQGLYINAGHFRNGLVMGPASAELLANLMTGETTIVDPAPYSPRLL